MRARRISALLGVVAVALLSGGPCLRDQRPQGAGQRVLGGQLGIGGRPTGSGEPGHQLPHAASFAVCVWQQPWSVDWSNGTAELERQRDLR